MSLAREAITQTGHERLRAEGRIKLAGTPQALWPLAADTEQINRVTGFPPVVYSTEARDEGGATIFAENRIGPFSLMKWVENPFFWQYPRFYYVEREYLSGPIKSFRGGFDLSPTTDGGTEVLVWVEIDPVNPLVRFAARRVMKSGMKSNLAQLKLFERYLLGEISEPFPQLRHRFGIHRVTDALFTASHRPEPAFVRATETGDGPHESEGAWLQLERGASNPELVTKLRQHLEESPDPQVVKMQPIALADSWAADRQETLALFLRATTAGLLVMTWEILCPHCRTPKASYSSLLDLQPQAYCDTCNVEYEAHFDQNVEVRFTVAASVRRARATLYCEGGPMNTPHRIARVNIPAGGMATIGGLLQARKYTLSSRQSAGGVIVDATGDGPSATGTLVLSLRADRISPDVVRVLPGEIALTVLNHLTVTATLDLEQPEWLDTAATAAYVSTLQEFRDQFSAEILDTGMQVAIQRMAFVFTDLSRSTAMYQELGEATAFKLVQEHFRVLLDVVSESRGAVVKTIGDSVMAVFPTASAAVEAGLAMQQGMRNLATDARLDPSRMLKVGIHQGPCVAASANGRLDYFGTSVNIASHIQETCTPGGLVLSADVAEDPTVAARLLAGGYTLTEETARLRGIAEQVRLVRVAPAAQAEPTVFSSSAL